MNDEKEGKRTSDAGDGNVDGHANVDAHAQRMTSTGAGSRTLPGTATLLDHERLDVYRVTCELLRLANRISRRRVPKHVLLQFDRSSSSILGNIGEGAGKTSRPDKQRYYEMARGSATETAAWLDLMHIQGAVNDEAHSRMRALLVRITQMLSRLVARPR